MKRCYNFRALLRIARKVGPCRPDHSRREMLEHIERAAQDYLIAPEVATARETRDQLIKLANVLAQAGKAYYALDWAAALALTSTAKARGIEPLDCDYLKKLADAAKAAAASLPTVKRGPQDPSLTTLICAIDAYVHHFAGWRKVYTYNGLDETYTGAFFEVLKACLEPLGTRMSDAALAGAIDRAKAIMRGKDKLTA